MEIGQISTGMTFPSVLENVLKSSHTSGWFIGRRLWKSREKAAASRSTGGQNIHF